MPIRTKEEARQWRSKLEGVTKSLDDVSAVEATSLYPMWRPYTPYDAGQRIRHASKLYRCIQAHTAQPDWTPDITPALWMRISVEEYPEWVQPTGVQDAYQIGDKVTFGGNRYVSLINANTWSPSEYSAGWEKV